MMQNSDLMSFGLWLFTVLSVGIAILFGIISSIFAIINTVITPIEVVTGMRGLFLWNGFAGKLTFSHTFVFTCLENNQGSCLNTIKSFFADLNKSSFFSFIF